MVEIIPKPTEKAPLWTNIVFYIGLVAILAVIAAYFFLGYITEKNNKILEEKKTILNQLKTAETQELERKVFSYQKKITDFDSLLKQHKASSGLFALLEEVTHPKVWLSGLSLDIQKAEVKLSGETDKVSLGQQLIIFKNNEEVLKSDLSSIIPKEGEIVKFDISLSLDPEIFKFLK